MFLVNTEKKDENDDFETVAQIEMEVDWKADDKHKYWVTKSTMVSPFYQGKGFAPKMYAALCRKGLTLRSDDLQSAGGKKIWIALSKIAGITVYAGKRLQNGEWELSDIDNDVDDFLRSGFQTYDVEDQEDTNLLRKELKQYHDAANKVGDDLMAIVKDPAKAAEADKLRAQIQDYQKVIDKIEAEIHKNMNKQRNMESRDVYLFATATPSKKTESVHEANQVKANEPMPKKQKPSNKGYQKHPYRGRLVGEAEGGNLKIHPVSVSDYYRGETFGTKFLTVDGVNKAGVDVSIVDDEVHISHIVTADDGKRKGYAKMLVDDLFKEFSDKKISVSDMTDDGSAFFRSQYIVDDETGEIKKKLGEDMAHEPDPTGYQHDLITMPANTLVVDTSGDLDWYKLGQHFARLNQQDPHEWGQGASDMVITLANKEQVERVKAILDRFGAEYKEIGGTDVHPEIHSDSAVKVDELKIQTPHPKDTLGVPRRHMPQIDEDHYKELFKYLFGKGVKVKKVTVDARDLNSTQSEFSDKGIEKSMTNGKMNKPIIISSDNYVLDGHHRWLAAKNGRKHEMTAFQVSVPAKEGLSLLINFPKTTFKDIHESENISGKQMLQAFYKMHHDAGNNKDMDKYILSHSWKLGYLKPDMIPSYEEVYDYDDPFDRVIDIDLGHSVDLSQPVIMGPRYKDGKYSIIDGNHRAYIAAERKKQVPAYFPIEAVKETAGVGKIVKGVNTTVDVGPNEITKQAAKFGNKVSKDGKPATVMTVNEALDQPYPVRWSVKNDNEWYGHAKEDDFYNQIGIQIRDGYNSGSWTILFRVGSKMDKTGEGDQFKIFATVKAAVQEWWKWASKNAQVDKITFSAEKVVDSSRSKLYHRFAQQFARAIGYEMEVVAGNKADIFYLNKPTKKITESKNISDEQIEQIMNGRYEQVGLKLPSKYTLWRGVGNSGKGMASYGTGLYTTTSKKYASQFGKVVQMGSDALPDFPIRFATINDYELWLQNAYKVLGFDGPREFNETYNDIRHFVHGQLGFDGIQIGTGRDIMFVQYPLK